MPTGGHLIGHALRSKQCTGVSPDLINASFLGKLGSKFAAFHRIASWQSGQSAIARAAYKVFILASPSLPAWLRLLPPACHFKTALPRVGAAEVTEGRERG